MRELEKILEEIKEVSIFMQTMSGYGARCVSIGAVEHIIRKHMNDGWIPVDKKLPPNAKHEGAFCPKYQVMTKFGVTEGWYNPNARGWYVLLWFETERYLANEIDLDKGDIPKMVFLSDEVNNEGHILTAWKKLESYHSERSDNHD